LKTNQDYELAINYLADLLSAEEVVLFEKRICQELELAALVIECAQIEVGLYEWTKSQPLSEPVRLKLPSGFLGWSVNRWVGLVALVGVAIFAAIFVPVEAGTPLPRIEETFGDVRINNGKQEKTASQGLYLFPGNTLSTLGEDGYASVLFPDETRVELGNNTRLVFQKTANQAFKGRKLYVEQGSLTADISSVPMFLATPHAEVITDHSRFRCDSVEEVTRFETETGLLKVARLGERSSIDLQKGYFTQTSVNEKGNPLILKKSASPLLTPLISLVDGTGPVRCIVYAPELKLIISGGADGKVRFWDPISQLPEGEFQAHTSPVFALAYSRSQKILATSGQDRWITIWDLITKTAKFRLPRHRQESSSLSFSPDGSILATIFGTSPEGGEVKLWSTFDGSQLGTFVAHGSGVQALAFSPKSNLLVTLGKDKAARFWTIEKNESGIELRPVLRQVISCSPLVEPRCLEFSHDGKLLVLGFSDGTISFFDSVTAKLLKTFKAHSREVLRVSFDPTTKLVASTGKDCKTHIWDISLGKELATLVGHRFLTSQAVFLENFNSLATAGWDRTIKLWKIDQRQLSLVK